MLNVPELLKTYSQVYWSPQPGYTYVHHKSGRWQGPGSMARQSPGAFNLYWLIAEINGRHLLRQYNELLHNQLVLACDLEVQGYPLGEWAVVLKPKEFYLWISKLPPGQWPKQQSPQQVAGLSALTSCIAAGTALQFTSLAKSSQPPTTTSRNTK